MKQLVLCSGAVSLQHIKLIISKLNRMDEKLEILMRRNVIASQAGAGHHNELPGIPDGLKLPAETVKDITSAGMVVARDERVRKKLVSSIFYCFVIL